MKKHTKIKLVNILGLPAELEIDLNDDPAYVYRVEGEKMAYVFTEPKELTKLYPKNFKLI